MWRGTGARARYPGPQRLCLSLYEAWRRRAGAAVTAAAGGKCQSSGLPGGTTVVLLWYCRPDRYLLETGESSSAAVAKYNLEEMQRAERRVGGIDIWGVSRGLRGGGDL